MAALALALVLGAGGLVAAPAADAASRVTLTATASASTVDRGARVTLRVAYRQGSRAVACCSLRLQARTTGGWRTVRKVTPRQGRAAVTVTPTVTTRYRFVTPSGRTRSAARTVTVRSAITVTASPASLTAGAASTLSATYRAHGRLVPRATVQLQQRAGTSWTTIARATVTRGRATFSVRPSATTSYRVTTTGLTVRSATRRVTVSPPPAPASPVPAAFTVTGAGYGHGVGMSQYVAAQMAVEGWTAPQILGHYYSGAQVATAPTPAEVAVQVFGSADAAATTFSVGAGRWALHAGDGAGAPLVAGDPTAKVQLKVVAGQPVAVVGGTTYPGPQWTGDRTVLRLSWNDTPGGAPAVASLAGTHGTYRHGRLTVRVVAGHLNVVNELLLNTQYLYGLGEVPSSWGAEALKAQVIAARNYAVVAASRPRSASCDCHVYDDTRSQNFTGWKKESEGTDAVWGRRWVAAVDATVTSATSAQLLTAGDALVNASYFSSSGGRTANSEDVWSATVGYLRSVDDPFSATPANTMRSWTRTLTQARAATVFGVSDIVRIDVAAVYSSGQMRTLRATTATGTTVTVTRKADQLRSLLGLPAAWVSAITPA